MYKSDDSSAVNMIQRTVSGTGQLIAQPQLLSPCLLVYEVGDPLAATRAIAEELVAAIERGQKRFQDLPESWWTVEQAATYLNLSPDTVERLAGCGKLKSAEVRTDRSNGKRSIRRFKREWLDEFMYASCPPPPPPPVDPATRRKQKSQFKDYF